MSQSSKKFWYAICWIVALTVGLLGMYATKLKSEHEAAKTVALLQANAEKAAAERQLAINQVTGMIAYNQAMEALHEFGNRGTMIIDEHGNIKAWSKVLEHWTGFKQEDVVGKPMTMVLPQPIILDSNQIVSFDFELFSKDKTQIPARLRAKTVSPEQGKPFTVAIVEKLN